MNLYITAFYASLLALCYFYLSALVIKERRAGAIGIGDGGNTTLQRLIRAHGNFSEYVPICLVMLATFEVNAEMNGVAHALGASLLFGRLLHAYGLRLHAGASWQRLAGMLLTFAAMILLACFNLYVLYWTV